MPIRVAVVGGGIAGVTAALELRDRLHDAEITLLEAAPQLGGKLGTREVGGVRVDTGAESMLARRPEGTDLARRVGLADDVVHPNKVGAAIWTRGALRPMPPTVMGVPADRAALAASGVLSRSGVLRTRADVPRALPERDVSVGDFVASRLGREVVDRLVEPLLGGVYAGHAHRLSLTSAAPQVAALVDGRTRLVAAAAGSLARTRSAAGGATTPVFAGIRGGIGRLPDAVAAASGADVVLGATVRELHRTADGWRLVHGPTTHPVVLDVDAVVLAVPGAPTARLVGEVAPVAARALREVKYASMAIVTLAVDPATIDPALGSGFLVPPVDGRSIKAATFSSRKWGWLEPADGGPFVLRTSVGRAGEEALLQRDDHELVELAMADLAEAAGLRGPLVDAHVHRWGGALPQYTVGHAERIATVEDAVARVPGLELCGAAYHGVGIPAVVAGARAAAGRVADRWRTTTGAAPQWTHEH
ncbi:protoporphyrinogen oxidase [Solicola sp. PLA-1-18]|uniref:protoporphyrinogen oxidase n=1 Tax=Solicola sp. PLA-1-18 TaxID=3380532 RepID=UPI003B81B8B6